MDFINQCKGKDISKIAKSKYPTLDTQFIISVKYDGNYVQIHKNGDKVKFYTSGGKEFYWKDVADAMLEVDRDFILEAEYIGNSDGKLGDRVHASTGHDRSLFSKGIENNLGARRIKVFDIISDEVATERLQIINKIVRDINHCGVECIFNTVDTLLEANEELTKVITLGYEGLMLREINSTYQAGKRVNDVIKLKRRPTADLKCIGIVAGEGKYEGMIGSLMLEDGKGIRVDVGSGLTDEQRDLKTSEFVGKIVEIEYEQIIDTYIQPVFVQVRKDKVDGD
jgi:ATP-dependent DNA ligase